MKKSVMMLVSILLACSVSANAFGPKPSEGISLSVGPGIGYQEKYSGSEEREINFIPYIDVEYVNRKLAGFLSISDGLGIKYRMKYPGLFASGGINLGNSRRPGDADILEGTAKVKNYATYFIEAGYESGFFDISAILNYYPVDLKYKNGMPDEHKNGLTCTFSYLTGYPVLNNLLTSAEAGFTVMNSDYAHAYYGIKYPTGKVNSYKPGAGLRNLYIEPTIIFFTGYDISINIQGRYERVLGDAAKSPIVKTKNMFTGLMYISYDI
jgi:outer membrane scaffolding protein for murein synthesis (MipA/OmpV family)